MTKNNFDLHHAFVKLMTLLGKLNGVPDKEIRMIVSRHPHSEDLIHALSAADGVEDDIQSAFDNCISTYDEIGPNREYFTLFTLLNDLAEDFMERGNEQTRKLTTEILEKFRFEIDLINQKIPKPTLVNMVLESRSLVEWASIYFMYPFIPKRIKGHRKPVLLIPPYLADDKATSFVRRYLSSLGFKTYKWEQGFNMIKAHYLPRLEEKLDDIYSSHGEKVSIVGWSGGGMFAKIIANRHPEQVEQIVTIGSPVWGVMDMKSHVDGVLQFFRGKSLKEKNKKFIEELEPIPEVPVTCIYTKTDGVVPWKHCVEAESYRDDIRNIEVFGSHSGLGANVSVLMITANALSANLQGKSIQDNTTNIERVLYPNYWIKKKESLFFTN
ncbi:MAG: alpha/beta hydrolase [Bacteroidota bacterium]